MLTSLQSRPWVQRSLLVVCFIAVTAHGYVTTYLREIRLRDFDVHREVGRRFLTGEYLYANGLCHPYMPIAALYFAPLALFDRGIGLALRYITAVACLCLTLFLLYRMVREWSEVTPPEGLWISGITLLLALQFILQDLDDGGPHLILLAILTAGVYAVWQGCEKWGAMWFSLAIALKVSPGLFLPFFVWKRQWRLAGYTAVASICWIILPMIWMGPESWWNHQREWTQVAAGSFVGQETPITRENEQRVRNQSLQQALMRYLVTFPEDHPLRRDDPGYVPVLNLPVPAAKIIIMAVILSLLIFFCWHTRRPFTGRGDSAWLRESSAVMIFMLLLSPVTWVQHLVWLVPAIYLVVVDARSNTGLGSPATIALGVYVVLADVLNYELLGKQKFELLLSYHPYTVAMVLVLAMLMFNAKFPRRGTHPWSTAGLHVPNEKCVT
jgi:alpha-1,2-mannosyltransferase